jgi:cytochrome bd ubiquinol oxidase subunit II
METVWFIILALMLATYVVLDGFDFGAGILHLFVAKTNDERRTVLSAIGPFWDGNEVWLLAGGGVLVFAFPRAYSAGFSGFYMPLMTVLWLLIFRGISIEFRPLENNNLWRSFWDGMFAFASILMAIVLGAALGNVIRGVPLLGDGFFSGPLFTNFQTGRNPGVLDWYTVLVGIFTLAMLAMHGALFLRMKTTGELNARCSRLASSFYVAVVAVGILASIATVQVQPKLLEGIVSRPLAWLLTVGVFASLIAIPLMLRKANEKLAFAASCGLIVSMLAATATGLYPTLLSSTINPAHNLTIHNASSGPLSLQVGLYWWVIAIVLAIGYFTYLFRSFSGKVILAEGEGH